ncbi:uncharacterized protein LOC132305138 [Cornus florida]|uniref:uncharacterized protein LOC132305138 n=1 Tax=Cornus florida TaxID=4283 RepID=UPI0028A2DCB7|nr:uncharacterized protein LOC132305138 [Cornus florida]
MLQMKLGESVIDYFSQMMAIVNKMRIHGDKIEDVTVIEKILRSLTSKFNYVVCSIKESKELDDLSIDELQGSLLVHEQKFKQQEKEEQALQVTTSNKFSAPNSAGRRRGGARGNKDQRSQQQFQHQKSEDNQFHGSQWRGRGRGNNQG